MIKKINQGLTLIEIIVFISITILMACFAIPVFQMKMKNDVLATEQQLFSALQFARIQAVLNQKNTIVRSADWNKELSISFENETPPLRVESFEYTVTSLTAFNNVRFIKFYPDGHSMTNGHFDISAKSNDTYTVKIIFDQSGRIRRE